MIESSPPPFARPAALLLMLTLAWLPDALFASPRVHKNDLPPRLQWNENSGYCGEVSFISAGLYYGQYLSQYDARATVAPRATQNRDELLIGVNDLRAAAQMHLQAVEWDTRRERSTDQFLQWVKRQVVRGFPVVIGVFNNEYLLYRNPDPKAGDPSYDHIVPVLGVRSPRPLDRGRFDPRDTLIFSDNGLWGDRRDRPYIFRVRFGEFPADRARANAPSGPVYALSNDARNYGVAITGVVDPKHETLPVRVRTNLDFESPQIENGSNRPPSGRLVTLAITISGLRPGADYRLYRYDSLAAVPDSDFNARAGQAAQSWKIQIASGASFTFSQTINSNDVAVYRAVPAEAP